MVEAAERLGQELETSGADRGRSGARLDTGAADDLAHEIAQQLTWLRGDACPDVAAGVELRAAFHVYRNASFAYRRVVSLPPGSDTAAGIATTCSSLLTQAAHHLYSFRLHIEQGA